MEKNRAEDLLTKYMEGKCNQEEIHLFERIYNKILAEQPDLDIEQDLSSVKQLIYKKIPFPNGTHSIRSIYKYVSIAASFFLVIGVFFYYYKSTYIDKSYAQIIKKEGVVPGSNGATLVLANGKKIVLNEIDSGLVAEEGGVIVTKNKGTLVYSIMPKSNRKNKVSYHTLTTAKGENIKIKLPDLTVITLNAASSITFATDINELAYRNIEFIGEAFFEVHHDEQHPFIVKTRNQEIEVLGTVFNVFAYPDEKETRTTLLKGSVRILKRGSSIGSIVLKPGQEAIYNGEKMMLSEADLETVMAWRNDIFQFDNESIHSVMKKISRWYVVDVVFEKGYKNDGFTGIISRKKSLDQVLNILEKTKGIHFKMEGRRIIVME